MAGVVAAAPGCKKDVPATLGNRSRPIETPKGVLYRLELHLAKLHGGGLDAEEAARLRLQVDRATLFVYWDREQTRMAWVGLEGPAGSYGSARHVRVKVRADHRRVRVPSTHLEMTLRDGTVFGMDLDRFDLRPSERDEGRLGREIVAEGSGVLHLTAGDSHRSASFDATWYGERDGKGPEVLIVAPDRGLVSGAFDVYFDEPVSAPTPEKLVFLRDEDQRSIPIQVDLTRSSIPGFVTRLRATPRQLLPFASTVSLTVGRGFADLAGNRLDRPAVTVVDTPSLPPLMNSAGHDFDAARVEKETEFRLQGLARFVPEYEGIRPYAGQLLVLTPPPAASTRTSALVARLKVPYDATHIQIRTIKVARTRDVPTPCLRFAVAQRNGVLWNVECGPTDVPTVRVERPGGEVFTTPWVPLTIDVRGQRGQEIVLLVEARPLDPEVPPQSQPVFLVDLVRMVWEGEDPRVIRGELRMPPP